ncbi:MAG: hypothetical protein K0V04_08275 [Deltaproteobacteria bacterium]|nr:hypothetical protein [Deltaproteobacteria bacterium]
MNRFALCCSLLATLLVSAPSGCVIIDDPDDSGGAGTDGNNGDNGNGDNNGDNGADDTAGGGGNPPSDQQVLDCRAACDQLQFFSCISADEHQSCYDLCSERDADAVAVFDSCVSNTTPSCDEAVPCYENLVDAPSADDGEPPEATCVDACEEWLGAGCEALDEVPSCQAFCDSLSDALQQVVVECIEGRDGCTLPESCALDGGGGEGGAGEG